MDGLHDLGGKQGFGRVKYPSAPHNENLRPLVRALHAFAIESHIYNMDEFRHAIERMTPRHYIQRTLFRAPPDRDSHIAYREGNRNTGGTRVAGRWRVPIVGSVGTRPTSFCSTILCNRRDS